WMLGHRADSQTVCRFRSRKPVFSLLSDSKWVRLLRAQAGRRGLPAAAAPAPICTRDSLTLLPYGMEIEVFQLRFDPAHGLGVAVRADHYAHQVVGTRRHGRWISLLLERLHQDLGLALLHSDHLPVGAGSRGRSRLRRRGFGGSGRSGLRVARG